MKKSVSSRSPPRLATHKLAELVEVESIPDVRYIKNARRGIRASIDWARIADATSLDSPEMRDAISLSTFAIGRSTPGTTITLKRLKGQWTESELKRFYSELHALQPPDDLIDLPSKQFVGRFLRAPAPLVRDSKGSREAHFVCQLQGELEAGESYSDELLALAQWVVEIDATRIGDRVAIRIAPKTGVGSKSDESIYEVDLPSSARRPRFYSRLLIRENKSWSRESAGVKVYVEGFRVPPYGDPQDDWLHLDADYTERGRSIKALTGLELDDHGIRDDRDAGLSILRNNSYRGAVFMTRESSEPLRMLVNREGFIPDTSFEAMREVLRVAIGLSIRVRAAATAEQRAEDRMKRAADKGAVHSSSIRKAVEQRVQDATEMAKEARTAAARGDTEKAAQLLEQASRSYTRAGGLAEYILTEPQMMRTLAGLGTQVASLVHEVRGLLGLARTMEAALKRLRATRGMPAEARSKLVTLYNHATAMRAQVERQAHYLTDLTAPDSRRRRSRQVLRERVEKVLEWFEPIARERDIAIEYDIPTSLKTPPMFPAELGIVLSNLLSNAIKAAGSGGQIDITAQSSDGVLVFWIQNTGRAIDLASSEQWFVPFKSTSTKADLALGQGIGMGLPIVRSIVEDVDGAISFVQPDEGFAVALEVQLGRLS